MELGQVAAGADPASGQGRGNHAHQINDAVRRFMRDGNRHAAVCDGEQLFFKILLLAGKKAIKGELPRVKAADGKRACHGGRTRNGKHLDACLRCFVDEHAAGVADAGCACVGDDGDVDVLGEHALDERRGTVFFVMLMVGYAGRVDAEMIEQGAGDPRIFRSDQRTVFQRFQRTGTDIGKIADRRCDDVKTRHVRSSCYSV